MIVPNAVVQHAKLEIRVPYPADLAGRIEDEKRRSKAAATEIGAHTRATVTVDDQPDVVAFTRTINWAGIRGEFRRKAKKIGATVKPGDFPVQIQFLDDCVIFTCLASK